LGDEQIPDVFLVAVAQIAKRHGDHPSAAIDHHVVAIHADEFSGAFVAKPVGPSPGLYNDRFLGPFRWVTGFGSGGFRRNRCRSRSRKRVLFRLLSGGQILDQLLVFLNQPVELDDNELSPFQESDFVVEHPHELCLHCLAIRAGPCTDFARERGAGAQEASAQENENKGRHPAKHGSDSCRSTKNLSQRSVWLFFAKMSNPQ
jgi:hypothetical protein